MQGSWKKKLGHIWMYYKLPICVTVGLLVVFTYFLHAKLTEKDCAFNAILFDVHTDVSEEALSREFADCAGIDTGIYEVQLSTSLLLADGTSNYAMTSRSRFYALIGTEDLDVVMMCKENFESYTGADAFLDLRTVFTEKELAAFPKLYTDRSGRVLGIYANELPKINAIGGYSGRTCVAGIIYNTRHIDRAKRFFDYLMCK